MDFTCFTMSVVMNINIIAMIVMFGFNFVIGFVVWKVLSQSNDIFKKTIKENIKTELHIIDYAVMRVKTEQMIAYRS